MVIRFTTFVLLALVLLPIKNASAQAADTPWQIGVVTENLTKVDTSVAVSNSGASSTIASPQNGAICINVYATSAPLSSIAACCTCRVSERPSCVFGWQGGSRSGSAEGADERDQAIGLYRYCWRLQCLDGRDWRECSRHRHAVLARARHLEQDCV